MSIFCVCHPLYGYLKDLTEACYRLNPNERSAREGELIALEFMKGMNPNQSMQKYIDKSIESYTNYQNNVLKSYSMVDEFISKADEFIKKAQTVEAKKLIDQRIEYLKNLKKLGLLNVNGVQKSIDLANEKNELNSSGPLMGE